MILIGLICATTVLWQEEFDKGVGDFSQLHEYEVKIENRDGKLILTANPRFEGFASAWMAIDDKIEFTRDDILRLRIRVKDNKVRLRYFYLAEEGRVYYAEEEFISRSENWQVVTIPFICAKPFYSSNFPWALTPGKKTPFFLFIENALPGSFEVEIDRIEILRLKGE
ncbi:hypothetical protein DRP53_01090 [candidate division WOR-3 bacterium]|uniref:NADH:ubiquinone oxidoreductase intermediate-associated protein 30 domain-containing protein n=1 Tax=candidate division WOR-3 bacterium TaxID=2052148 RepID=A0A660SM13_UNCW3|nr:MAG: hypothetical protein DRP53_01090 [candidate division WOR-3 bacterium]